MQIMQCTHMLIIIKNYHLFRSHNFTEHTDPHTVEGYRQRINTKSQLKKKQRYSSQCIFLRNYLSLSSTSPIENSVLSNSINSHSKHTMKQESRQYTRQYKPEVLVNKADIRNAKQKERHTHQQQVNSSKIQKNQCLNLIGY